MDTTWYYGDIDKRNLDGTTRTLDTVNGNTHLDKGLISRDGWTIVDDSKTLILDENNMPRTREENKFGLKYKDIYFFGYGHEYKQCLRDYCKITGQVPLIPKWALGNWWSRYYEYSEDELKDVVSGFQEHEIPLSVCIIDMDWHLVKDLPVRGWTGYTWNKDLFPDPKSFIDWLHERGIKTALNLHPADGVYPHEEMYEEMADFLGIDPQTKDPIDFDITSTKFIEGYFKYLHHPREEEGVDFWWLDWQQGTDSKVLGLDPLWMLNHLHLYDLGRKEEKRPFIFSRWSGLGSHRYPIGFSGDTIISWDSLRYQPYFTSTAANVGFGWWSHDIGGHYMGLETDELYTRWIQFGVFSPILRIHSSNMRFIERLPWKRGEEAYKSIKDALCLRHTLIPYIYSMAWKETQESNTLITPMYYNHPEENKAYDCPNQYYFGSELIVSPFTSERNKDTNLARQYVWIPKGHWFDFFTGEYYEGDKSIAVYGKLKDIPVFAKGGAIIPLALDVTKSEITNPKNMEISIFPGATNDFCLYEDDGNTQNYKKGIYAMTKFNQKWLENKLEFTINAVEGDKTIIPKERTYTLKFRGVKQPETITAIVDNQVVNFTSNYNETTETLILTDIASWTEASLTITLYHSSNTLMSKGDRVKENFERMLWSYNMPTIIRDWLYKSLEEFLKGNFQVESYDYTDNNLKKSFNYFEEISSAQLIGIIETIKKQDILSVVK